jgi:hypothetical protein
MLGHDAVSSAEWPFARNEESPMTELLEPKQTPHAEPGDDAAELVRRHKESLFPSVGLNYGEPIELRWGERQYVYDGAGRQNLD